MLCCARILGIVEVNIGLQMQQDREAANAIEQVNAFVPVRPQRKLKDQRGDHEQDRQPLDEHAHARMGEALASEWSGNAAEMASRPLVRVRVCLSSCLAETNSGRAPLLPSTHWRECRRTMATPCSQSSHSRMLLALRCKRAAPRCIMLQHATWGVAECRARAGRHRLNVRRALEDDGAEAEREPAHQEDKVPEIIRRLCSGPAPAVATRPRRRTRKTAPTVDAAGDA